MTNEPGNDLIPSETTNVTPHESTNKPTVSQIKEDILAALNVRDFYERYLTDGERLSAANINGWTDRVKCPLHEDKKTPNFFVNLTTGGFNCKSCMKSGSVFDFWIYKDGRDPKDRTAFSEALVGLANFAGLQIGNIQARPGYMPPKRREADTDGIPKLNEADANDSTKNSLPMELVYQFHNNLQQDHYTYFLKKRGIRKDTVDAYQLGWDPTWIGRDKDTNSWFHGRFTIPVFAKDGLCRNIRGYSPRCTGQYKINNLVLHQGIEGKEEGFGKPPRLFNLDRLIAFHWKHVVICEGEFDCILLNQYFKDNELHSWGAVTGTHGATTFKAEWVPYLYGCHVYICYDCDDPGKHASHEVATNHFLKPLMKAKFESVKIIELPLSGTPESKDLTNYFVDCGATMTDFIKLATELTPDIIAGGIEEDEATVPPLEVPDLVTALKDRTYIDERITVPITISGTTEKVYHAIREYKVHYCPLMSTGECCCIGAASQTIPYGHPQFIASCMQSESQNLKAIASMTCQHDEKCKVTPVRKVVMEAHVAHQVMKRRTFQEMDETLDGCDQLVEVTVYILQPNDNMKIELQDYQAVGFVRTHPHTSIATLFIESMTPIEEDWKKFTVESTVTQTMLREIKKLTVDELIEDIVKGVTHIYDADHILYLVLLTYLSPLRFAFNGNVIRGWLNTAIVGDSGTGKSKTHERFSNWIGIGEAFSGLTGTRTGLLYAIKQRANEWYVSAGAYVRASGKQLTIDEAQEIDPAEFKKMALAMELGYLKVETVASGGYNTAVRTMFLMNPCDHNRKACTLSHFTHGCDALANIFAPMFIRRLDAVIFVTGNHNYEVYNQENVENTQSIRVTSGMMRSLIHWAWTRHISQIVWTDQATKTCLRKATELSGVYGYCDDTPLVNPQDFRENLARLANAYAILDRNFSEDLQSVTIEVRHVEMMANFIDMIYSHESCNLALKSKNARSSNTLPDYEMIRTAFENTIDQAKTSPNAAFRDGNHFCQMVLLIEKLGSVRKRDLADQMAVDPQWVGKKLNVFKSFSMIEDGRYGHMKTKKFNLFMQRWRQEPKIAIMLDTIFVSLGKSALSEDCFAGYDNRSTVNPEFETRETTISREMHERKDQHNINGQASMDFQKPNGKDHAPPTKIPKENIPAEPDPF